MDCYKQAVCNFSLKMQELFVVFMLKFRFETAWPCSWNGHRNEFFQEFYGLYQESLNEITSENLLLVIFGAAVWKTNKELCDFWRKHLKSHPIILSIFSFILCEENWFYLRCAIPNHLTADNEMLASKKKCLHDFLLQIPSGIH